MISFECSKCGKKFTVPDEQGGRKGKCPQCQEIMIIPDASPPPRLTAAVVAPRDLLGDGPAAVSDGAERPARPRAKAAAPVKQSQPTLAKQPAVSQARSDEADGTSRLWVFGACGVAALFVVGLLVYVCVLRDTWEKDNREKIQGLSQEVISFARQDNVSAMVVKQGELKTLIGSRLLKNPELKTAVSEADAAVVEAKGRVAAVKQAADRKRREDEEKAAAKAAASRAEKQAAENQRREQEARAAENQRREQESRRAEEDEALAAEIRTKYIEVAQCQADADAEERADEEKGRRFAQLKAYRDSGISVADQFAANEALLRLNAERIRYVQHIQEYGRPALEAARRAVVEAENKHRDRARSVFKSIIADPNVSRSYKEALLNPYVR